jgi:mono/diheme cytochrome c family protein
MRTIFFIAMSFLLACTAVPRSGEASLVADPAPEHLYRARCASCHRLRSPQEKTRDEWGVAMQKYAPRAKLTAAERDKILAWLQKVAPTGRD